MHPAALENGVCLVAADRPGFGRSTHHPGRTISGFADDIRQLADHLEQPKFDVLGVSCGGPYALAAAELLPDRVGRVVLMAGMGPMVDPALRREQLPFLRLLFALSRLHSRLAWPLLALDRRMFLGNPAKALRMVSALLAPADRLVLSDFPQVAADFAESLAQAYEHGLAGALAEAALIARPHGVTLSRVTQPVLILQSGQDRHVPAAMGRHLAREITNAHLEMCPEEGHLSIVVNQAGRAMRWLAGAMQSL